MAFALCLMLAPGLQARAWRLLSDQSRLAFTGEAQGEAFGGRFARFAARIEFDAENPQAGSIDVQIETASIDSENQERDEALGGDAFFGNARFPKASFRAAGCHRTDRANAFRCDGELSIRDRKRKLPFDFTFSETDGRARLDASVPIDRLDYDIGSGDWADESVIARRVTVTVALKLM